MAGVDLRTYTFDYDLTFAVLLMNADGTIYHRYGSRDHTSATSRLSMTSLVRVMKETLEDHAIYQKKPSPPPALPPRTIEEIPPMARKLQKEKVNCFHCHMVNDAEREHAKEEKRWSRDAVIGQWPLPDRVGLSLDRDDQTLIGAVTPGSPAAAAELKAGDRLVRLGGARVRTHADVQWVLESAEGGATTIPVESLREGDMMLLGKLELEKGWKAVNELEFSWRPSVWPLDPKPGFGGRKLAKDDLEALGLPPGAFAIKIGYLVDWGSEAHTGRNARKAGLKEGDILLAAGGKSDFATELHFQSWFRFTQKPGTTIDLEVLRDGKRRQVKLPVVE
jgi:predicted metalloprotease with PDZ domain